MDPILFIGLMIVAIVQIIKMFVPSVHGAVTIMVAFLVAILVALLDVLIGVADIGVAEAIYAAFTAIGLSVLADKSGGGAKGDA